MSEAAYQKQAPLFELNQLKTVLALSLLKSMVDSNKSELKNVLLSYDKKVHGSSIIERSPMSSPESFVKSATPVPAGSDYTHAPSTQLQSNFHDFFQSMAENFEIYDIEREPSSRSSKSRSVKIKSKEQKIPAGRVHKPRKNGLSI